MSIIRRTDTKSNREYWDFVDETIAKLEKWPEWKKQFLASAENCARSCVEVPGPDDKKEVVREYAKLLDEERVQFGRKQREKLYTFCLDLDGHYFYDWQRELLTFVDSDLNKFVEKRICSACGYEETRDIEE